MVKRENLKYVTFSCDESNSDYGRIATGFFDAKIRDMLRSIPTALPGVQGVICLGNEPNAGNKGIRPDDYRAALEHVIDTFGYEPAPGFIWGVAFTNFNVWGQGSNAGRAWLPRRYDGPFMCETHFYGRQDYGDPADALGRTFLPAVREHPKWRWSIGEMSAQEDSTQTKKGAWLTKCANYAAQNGASAFLLFDTEVGGSAPIVTSENTRKAVKAIADKYADNDWS
jgi:hypothetical protein